METTIAPIILPFELYSDENYNKLRRGYIILIANLLNEYLISKDIQELIDTIIEIEKSAYNHALEIADEELLEPNFENKVFEQLYRTLITRITKALDHTSEVGDEHLASCILDGTFNPSKISWLKDYEISPINNQHLIDEFMKRLNTKGTVKTSKLYRCRSCGKRECTVRSVQMRSLDEGESLVITCCFCGYKWFN